MDFRESPVKLGKSSRPGFSTSSRASGEVLRKARERVNVPSSQHLAACFSQPLWFAELSDNPAASRGLSREVVGGRRLRPTHYSACQSNSTQIWVDSGPRRPMLVNFVPKLGTSRPSSAEFGRIPPVSAHFGRVWPGCRQVWPMSAKSFIPWGWRAAGAPRP